MKIVDIKWSNDRSPSVFNPNGISFCWLGAPENNVFPQASHFHACRETFAGVWSTYYMGYKWPGREFMNNKKLRICISDKRSKAANRISEGVEKDSESWMLEAVRILNILERTQGWGLTRIYKGKIYKDQNFIPYVFTGSAKWLRAPQLLSLYLLVIRISKLYRKTKKVENLEDLEHLAIKLKGTGGAYQIKQDKHYLASTIEYWKLILDNHKSLFFEKSQRENFLRNPGSCGISNLVTYKRADESIIKKFREICESNGK